MDSLFFISSSSSFERLTYLLNLDDKHPSSKLALFSLILGIPGYENFLRTAKPNVISKSFQ